MSESTNRKRPIWKRIPLYVQILIALVLGVGLGLFLSGGGQLSPQEANLAQKLVIPCTLVLKALRALATPLILLAVLNAFLTTEIPGRVGRRLAVLLLSNTVVAIMIGLLVANVLRPGTWGRLEAPNGTGEAVKRLDPWGLLQSTIPESILEPLVDNNVIQLIVVALLFGIALRKLKATQSAAGRTEHIAAQQVITFLFEAVISVVNWVITLVPLAVFGIVANTVATKGLQPFKALAALIVVVLLGLFLQACYYLLRVKFGSWVKPQRFLAGASEPLVTAFSTASSTVTMPITFQALKDKIGIRETPASMGALVGSNFNNDGTALYEAMAALFISQVIGSHLSLVQQLIVVVTAIVASVGAAGIPEAGLVTMTLVFTAVGLPTEYIALLVTVDWFLDRCRTAINVMGDMTVSCLLDGKHPKDDTPQLEPDRETVGMS